MVDVYFSDYFEIAPVCLEAYGAFNISLISDLPLFIDPFLLFNSKKPEYQQLHEEIIKYLRFLRNKSDGQSVHDGLLRSWYRFPEVKQTWLGFSKTGNCGAGLGFDFARALNKNLGIIFKNFGNENVTTSSHLEKLCLIKSGVGRDNISDFTTNLIKKYLLEYTQTFAQRHINKNLRKQCWVNKVEFNYETEAWERKSYDLPCFNRDHVLLTPNDLLTKDETWINKADLLNDYDKIPEAIPNSELRAQINNYFFKALPKKETRKGEKPKEPSVKEKKEAWLKTLEQFPEIFDYYIKEKEDSGSVAESISSENVNFTKELYVINFGAIINRLAEATKFYSLKGDTYEEALERARFLKDVIENQDGYRIFYDQEGDLLDFNEPAVHILYRFCWFATISDVNREVNNGRGPVDFKISRGSSDKCLVEFKLASNTKLKQNLQNQVEIYEKANGTKKSIKVIFYFNEIDQKKTLSVLEELQLLNKENIILVDARNDNKPSASNAK